MFIFFSWSFLNILGILEITREILIFSQRHVGQPCQHLEDDVSNLFHRPTVLIKKDQNNKVLKHEEPK